MSRIIAFPNPRPAAPQGADVATLAARLSQFEGCNSSDEAQMDVFVDAELTTLMALAAAPARDYADVTIKLATLVRRVDGDDEGFLSSGDLRLLRATLRDLRRLGRTTSTAAQA